MGTGKAVTVAGITITGTDAGNYSIASTTATTTANITPRALTVSATGVNKVYDGITAATVTLTDNRVAGDSFTSADTSAAFSDKNVGNTKTVTVAGITIAGPDAGNYSLTNTTTTTTANITPRMLTASATAVNKVYDGTTVATVTISDNRVAGDSSTDTDTSASFSDKNVGTGKTVTVAGITITGPDAGNYTLANTTATTTANITPQMLTVSATGVNKVYDGTTAATVILTDNRVAGDSLTDADSSATFTDKNAGTGKAVKVAGITITGPDAANYSLANTTATTTAIITPRLLTVSATGANKVYDGTTTATVSLTDNRVAGDAFTDSDTSATFTDKNAGTGKEVTVAGITIAGADASNYTLGNTTASTTANITPLALTISATGVNKVYEGTTAATVILTDNRVAGDSLTDADTSATFTDKNAGTGKAVTVAGITITGPDAANYSLANTTATTTANITPRLLTVSATGVNKVYDRATTETVSLTDNRVAGDVFTDSDTSASFTDKNAGTGKAVTAAGITIAGTDASNYTLGNTTASTTANIIPLALTISATGLNKVYDGTTAATVILADNRIAGDVFTDGDSSASFADKNVGAGKTVTVAGITITGTDAGNYTLTSTTAATAANITPRSLTVSATGLNKVYDGTTTATVILADNRVAGDTFTDTDTSATFSDKNVGTAKTLTVSGIAITGPDAGNYSLANTTATTTASITPFAFALTVSATGVNKVYDGTTAATVNLTDDRVAGDVFTDAYASANFTDKNVGTGKTVTVAGITITGPDAGNYSLTNTTATTTANITPRALTVSATGVSKVYDGTTTATVTLADNRITGDVFTDADNSANFTDMNVGTAKTVNAAGITITGPDAGNYSLADTSTTTTANITPRALTVSATGTAKVYDGTTTATVTLTDNRIAGDVFTDADTSASFTDKNVGTAKTVTVAGITITGPDAGNYLLPNTIATTNANITPLALTVGATGADKVYDGTTAATVTLADNRVAGDVFTDADNSATFTDKNVGTGKAVTVAGITITGPDAGNYSLANTTATTNARITPRTLTVIAAGASKLYDGTTAATVTLADNRIAGDAFTDVDSSSTFTDNNVGTSKTVTVAGIAITGPDAGNYSLANTSATTTANITPRALTVSATSIPKVYDGTAAATVTLADNRVAGDVFTDADASATFADKNVGTAKTVTVAGITITGPDAGNYFLTNTTTTTSASITPLVLTVSATGVNKVYDGTTTATVNLTDNRVAGDSFIDADTSAIFPDRNVGTGKAVTVAGITIMGVDAGNYSLASTTATTTANITPRALTVAATGVNKVYDGTTAAAVTLADNRVAGDSLTAADSAVSFADKNVGTGKPVTVAGITITGTDAGNYTLASTNATTTASITPRSLTVSANGVTKVYDGTTAASINLSDNRVAGDVFSDADSSATFTDKNVGTGKPVLVAGITITGPDAGNFSLASTTATTTASITPRALAVSATGVNKVYDGTTAATVSLTDNRVPGDSFTDADTADMFTDKNVGTAKAVTVAGVTITGPDASNYSLTSSSTETTTANITPRTLTVSATGVDRVYDGTTAATVTLADNRIAGDIITDRYTSANFADPSVGTGKPVTVSGITILGPDAGNYSLASTTASTTADITPAPLTITADNQVMVYGATLPTLSASFSGLVSGDSPADISGLSLSTVPGTSRVGTYPIVAANAVDPNYAIHFVPGTLSITPAALTITARNQVAPAGSALPQLTASFAGFLNGDSPSTLSAPVQLSAPSPAVVPAGSYPIVASGASSPDYRITFVSGNLVVTPKSLPAAAPVQAATTYLSTLYADLFGRSPDPAGLRYWRRRLHGGLSPYKVALAFERSREYLTTHQS